MAASTARNSSSACVTRESILLQAYGDTPEFRLNSEQVRYCSQALQLLRSKVRSQERLHQEFDALQVINRNSLFFFPVKEHSLRVSFIDRVRF